MGGLALKFGITPGSISNYSSFNGNPLLKKFKPNIKL